MRRFLMLIAVSVLVGELASAQRRFGPPTGTPHYGSLTVMVRLQNGRPITSGVKVELVNPGGLAMASAFTNNDGEARITNILSGTTYVLRVTGQGINPAMQEVFLENGETDQTVWVEVYARVNEQPTSKESSVKVTDLNVPPDARKEWEAGNGLAQKEQWLEAAQHYQKAIDLYPKYATAFNNLGTARVHLNDLPGAEKAYRQAVAINDKYANAWLNLAQLQYNQHDLQGAEDDLLKVLAADPTNVQALTTLAQTDLQLGKYDAAVDYVHKVNVLPHAGFAIVHVIGAYAYQKQNKPAEALAEYKLYLQEDPNGAMAPKVRATIASLEAQKTP